MAPGQDGLDKRLQGLRPDRAQGASTQAPSEPER